MPYHIQYDEELAIIRVVVEGKFNLGTLANLAGEVAVLIREHGCNRILNDMRHAVLEKSSIDIYSMPTAAQNAGVTLTTRRALLVSEINRDFRFLETVFINQGHQVRVFTGIEEANEWLLELRENKGLTPSDR